MGGGGVGMSSPAFRVGLQCRSAGPELDGSEFRERKKERDGDEILSRHLEAFRMTRQQV